MAPHKFRGALNIIFQLMTTLGIVVASLINYGTPSKLRVASVNHGQWKSNSTKALNKSPWNPVRTICGLQTLICDGNKSVLASVKKWHEAS